MAETVYKKISELPNATVPLAGTEYIEVSATGASKRATFTGIHGAGWWAKLSAALSAFKAPDADHADNADTLGAGLETPTDFHDATQLSGAVPLGSIPAELTGKTSDDSNAIEGIALSAGTSGAYGTESLSSGGGLWLIPSGMYMVTCTYINSTTTAHAVLEINNGSGGWAGPLNREFSFAGLVLSDGVNFRLRNYGTGTCIVYYRKLF